MNCSKKNSYLQLQYGSVKPETINRMVDKARKIRRLDPHDALHPLNRLCSQQPTCSVKSIDFTRRKCGYGKLALEQLKNDLSSYDIDVILRAVSTIGDMAIDPEKAIQIIKARMPQRMLGLFEKGNTFLTERICDTFAKLAVVPNGKLAIANDISILRSIQKILEGETHTGTLMKVGKCLENISNFLTTADELVDQGFILTILNVVARQIDEVATLLMTILKNLMYGNGNYIAMEYGAFPIMIEMLRRMDTAVSISALNCLMVMTSTHLGKQLAIDCDILQTLTNMLCLSENTDLDAALTSVLMFCTIKEEAKLRASKIKTLIPRLIKISRNPLHPSVQMFVYTTLLNLAVHFELRAVMQKKYVSIIVKTGCSTPLVCSLKEKLLQELSAPS